ncbi:hypothetical protein F5X71_34450 [Nocardia brasiliensis]|uniref:Uncharacterized protein n=1 Tax=Nocardia brasiliensis TaxID=37326 RepID=A0A6G9Y0K4_NOCBR|nr:hypothetical protein [Nocardia brasiliensis]QIS06729.1 hypothetical protein F5X71_34450 [Nocardia brasiliensis]
MTEPPRPAVSAQELRADAQARGWPELAGPDAAVETALRNRAAKMAWLEAVVARIAQADAAGNANIRPSAAAVTKRFQEVILSQTRAGEWLAARELSLNTLFAYWTPQWVLDDLIGEHGVYSIQPELEWPATDGTPKPSVGKRFDDPLLPDSSTQTGQGT